MSEWISVKDRLPDSSEMANVDNQFLVYRPKAWSRPVYVEYRPPVWWQQDNNTFTEITHWQPIPAPPD